MRSLSQNISILGRKAAIEEVDKLFIDGRHLLGIGLGNGANWRGIVSTFLSLYNQVFIYTGIVGLIVFLLFLFNILSSLFRNYLNKKNDMMNRKICLIYFLGLSAMLVQRMAFAGFLTDTYLWVAFALGIYIEKNYRTRQLKPREVIPCKALI